jgi:hypothetical protein
MFGLRKTQAGYSVVTTHSGGSRSCGMFLDRVRLSSWCMSIVRAVGGLWAILKRQLVAFLLPCEAPSQAK